MHLLYLVKLYEFSLKLHIPICNKVTYETAINSKILLSFIASYSLILL